jgi:nicotinamidase-related amidase
MICSANTPSYRQILIDIDTQSHFFCRHSSLCIRNSRGVLGNIHKVMDWAQAHHVPTISTLQVRPDHATDLDAPQTCQLSKDKPPCTVSRNHVCLPAADTLDWSVNLWDHYDQVILKKRSFDPFDELRLDRVLTELPVAEYILIGTALEGAVRATALGLLLRQKKVTMITNAVGTLDRDAAQGMLNLMNFKGVRLVKANAFIKSQEAAPVTALH